MVSTGVKIALPYVVLLIIWCVFREPGIRCCQCSRSRLTALPWDEGWLAELPTSVSDQSYAWRTLSFHFFSELRNPNRLAIFLPCLLCIRMSVHPVEEESSMDGVVCEACGLLEEPCSEDPCSCVLLLVFLFFVCPCLAQVKCRAACFQRSWAERCPRGHSCHWRLQKRKLQVFSVFRCSWVPTREFQL